MEHQIPSTLGGGAEDTGDTEIADLDDPVAGEEDVLQAVSATEHSVVHVPWS